MLEAYRHHAAERAALGIPPLPLDPQQTAQVIELLKNPPAGEEQFLLDLIVIVGAWWMIERTRSGAWNSNDPAGSITMVTTTAGMLVGVISVVLLLAFVTHRRAGN